MHPDNSLCQAGRHLELCVYHFPVLGKNSPFFSTHWKKSTFLAKKGFKICLVCWVSLSKLWMLLHCMHIFNSSFRVYVYLKMRSLKEDQEIWQLLIFWLFLYIFCVQWSLCLAICIFSLISWRILISYPTFYASLFFFFVLTIKNIFDTATTEIYSSL